LRDFVVDDLSNWYVRVSRDRFWAPDGEADAAAVATLQDCLVGVSRLLAPAAPFASDWLHRAITGRSVHLAGWPLVTGTGGITVPSPALAGSGSTDPQLEVAMDAIRRLASLARAARERGKLRVRQPLATLQVAVPAAARGPVFDRLLGILQAEVNVKRIETVASDTDLVRLKAKPNFRSLGKRYGKQTPEVAKAAERLTPDQVRTLEAGGEARLDVNGMEVVYFPPDVVVEREVTTTWLVESAGPYVAALDPTIDSTLAAEGLARELVHHVQRLRREAGYLVSDRIALGIEGPPAVVAAVEGHREFIATETLVRSLEVGRPVPGADLKQAVEVEGYEVTFTVRRHQAAD